MNYEDADLTPEEMRQLLSRLGREADWDDPQMDAYDNYDEERRKKFSGGKG